MWNFFRLENEHLNNCGQFRAVRDISIAPINSNDQALLQQMMDDEDGVIHRRSMSAWTKYVTAVTSSQLVVTMKYLLSYYWFVLSSGRNVANTENNAVK